MDPRQPADRIELRKVEKRPLTIKIPAQKVGTENEYPFNWMAYLPKKVPVQELSTQTRLANTERREG